MQSKRSFSFSRRAVLPGSPVRPQTLVIFKRFHVDGKASTWLQTLESVCSDPSPTDPGRIQEGGKAKEFGGGAEGDTRGISGRRATRVSARPDSNPSERPALLRERENPIKSAGKENGRGAREQPSPPTDPKCCGSAADSPHVEPIPVKRSLVTPERLEASAPPFRAPRPKPPNPHHASRAKLNANRLGGGGRGRAAGLVAGKCFCLRSHVSERVSTLPLRRG